MRVGMTDKLINILQHTKEKIALYERFAEFETLTIEQRQHYKNCVTILTRDCEVISKQINILEDKYGTNN